MSKVLVLTGSARPNSNSASMAKAFADKATALGHGVTCASVFDHDIKPCRGCGKCYSNGEPCVFADDFGGIEAMWNRIVRFMHWDEIGRVMQEGVWYAGDVLKTDALAASAAIAERI